MPEMKSDRIAGYKVVMAAILKNKPEGSIIKWTSDLMKLREKDYGADIFIRKTARGYYSDQINSYIGPLMLEKMATSVENKIKFNEEGLTFFDGFIEEARKEDSEFVDNLSKTLEN